MIIQNSNGRWCTSWRTGGGRSEEPRTARLWETRPRVPALSRRDIKHEITRIYIDLRSFFFEHICSFVFVNMTCYKWSQFAAGGQRGWSFPGLDDWDGSLCCDGCSRVFLGFKKRVGKPKRTIQTPNTAKTHTSPNCQFPSKIKRSSPDWQSEPFTEWSDVQFWSKRQKGSVHASRFLSQTTSIFATCVDWKLN